MCLQSCPRAGNWMRLKVIGHLREILIAVCSTPSCSVELLLLLLLLPDNGLLFRLLLLVLLLLELAEALLRLELRALESWLLELVEEALELAVVVATELKLRLILVMQWSAGRRRFFSRFCSTDRTLGRCTSCSTNK